MVFIVRWLIGRAKFGLVRKKKVFVFMMGDQFSFLNDKNLGGPAVRSIFQDTKGKMSYGNNGGGLFCYDGKNLKNIPKKKN